MKKSYTWAALAVCLLAASYAASFLFAQGGGPRSNSVVVIDITKVFNKHQRFKQSMEVFKKDAEKFDDYLKREKARLVKVAESRKQYKVGSSEYKRIDEQLAQESADIQAEMQLKKKEFFHREAELYYNSYSHIIREITDFCDRRNISLVLRYNSEPIDPENRISVQKGVNASIVFQRNLDITQIIIARVNQNNTP